MSRIQVSILFLLIFFPLAPGKYDLGSTLSETRYTMRPKLENDFMVLTKGVPGPGQYNPLPAINEKGRYPLSKYSNSCATIINPARSKRFPKDFCIYIFVMLKHQICMPQLQVTIKLRMQLEYLRMENILLALSIVQEFEVFQRRKEEQDQLEKVFLYNKYNQKELPLQEVIGYHLNLDIMRLNTSTIKAQNKRNDNMAK